MDKIKQLLIPRCKISGLPKKELHTTSTLSIFKLMQGIEPDRLSPCKTAVLVPSLLIRSNGTCVRVRFERVKASTDSRCAPFVRPYTLQYFAAGIRASASRGFAVPPRSVRGHPNGSHARWPRVVSRSIVRRLASVCFQPDNSTVRPSDPPRRGSCGFTAKDGIAVRSAIASWAWLHLT